VHVAETLVDQLPHAPGRQQVGEVQQGIELGADAMARRGCLQRGEKPLAAGLGERVDFAVRAVRLAFLPAYHQAFPRELGECGIDRAEARDIEVAEHLLELLLDVVAARFALREDAEAQRFYVQGHGLEVRPESARWYIGSIYDATAQNPPGTQDRRVRNDDFSKRSEERRVGKECRSRGTPCE